MAKPLVKYQLHGYRISKTGVKILRADKYFIKEVSYEYL